MNMQDASPFTGPGFRSAKDCTCMEGTGLLKLNALCSRGESRCNIATSKPRMRNRRHFLRMIREMVIIYN